MRPIRVSMLVAAAAATLAWGGSAVAWSGQGSASATQSSYPYSLSQCNQLPASEKPICKVEAAGAREHLGWQPSASQKQTLAQEQRRYQSAVAQCEAMPGSERNTCMSDAGLDQRLNATG